MLTIPSIAFNLAIDCILSTEGVNMYSSDVPRVARCLFAPECIVVMYLVDLSSKFRGYGTSIIPRHSLIIYIYIGISFSNRGQ